MPRSPHQHLPQAALAILFNRVALVPRCQLLGHRRITLAYLQEHKMYDVLWGMFCVRIGSCSGRCSEFGYLGDHRHHRGKLFPTCTPGSPAWHVLAGLKLQVSRIRTDLLPLYLGIEAVGSRVHRPIHSLGIHLGKWILHTFANTFPA